VFTFGQFALQVLSRVNANNGYKQKSVQIFVRESANKIGFTGQSDTQIREYGSANEPLRQV
jgi:hypothetical protein